MSLHSRRPTPLERWLRPAVFLPLLVALALGISYWFAGFRIPASDEGALLTNATKILRGGVFYRDVDAYPFPLAPYLLAGWMGLFGEHLSVSRGLASLVYAIVVASLYAASLTLLGRRRAAVFGLALLGFKFLAWPSFTAYFYWDVAFAFACIAVALLLRHRFAGPTAGLAAAGLAAGLALLSKQNLGIYLAGAAGGCLLLAGPLLGVRRTGPRQLWGELLVFAGGLVLPVATMAAYFAAQGLLGTMLYSGLVRPFTGYLPTSGIPFSTPLEWWRLGELQGQAALAYVPGPLWEMLIQGRMPGQSAYPAFWLATELFSRTLYTSIPLALVAVVALGVRARRSATLDAARPLLLLAVLCFAVLLSAFPRADYAHVISLYPLMLLLLFALWGRLGARDGRVHPRLALAEAGVVALLLAVTSALAVTDHRQMSHRLRLERADLRVVPSRAWLGSLVRYVDAETAADDRIFIYGQEAAIYFLADRRFPWPFSQLYPGQAGDDDGAALVRLIERERPKLVLRGMMAWPGLPGLGSYTARIDEHLRKGWERDSRVFDLQPLPAGQETPKWWVMSVLRPCPAYGADGTDRSDQSEGSAPPCVTFDEFMATAPKVWE